MDLKELESGVNPETNWYYRAKALILERYFVNLYNERKQKINVLDIGSGSGFFSIRLCKKFPDMIEKAWLVDINYTDQECMEKPDPLAEKTKSLPSIPANSIIILMDVLEHIEDDIQFLSEIKSRIQGPSWFFSTVPAFNSLWSGHDVYLGHFRRYKLNRLKEAFEKNNITVDRTYYYYGVIFPAVWLFRKLFKKEKEAQSDMKPVPGFINESLFQVLSIESRLSKMNGLFGVSCVSECHFDPSK